LTQTVVIHQPDFAPYLGFFHRFLRADLYIVLDHVQFVNGTANSWTHRDKIKTPNGEQWLTLATRKAPRDTAINAIELSTTVDWATSNLNLLAQNYRKAPFYAEVMAQVERLYQEPPALMADFNLRVISWLMGCFDVVRPMVRSSTLDPQGQKNELLIDLLKKTNGTRYISGTGARGYMNEALFVEAGIAVDWQVFHHPVYPQMHGHFIPYLSAIDILMNCGLKGAKELLRNAE